MIALLCIMLKIYSSDHRHLLRIGSLFLCFLLVSLCILPNLVIPSHAVAGVDDLVLGAGLTALIGLTGITFSNTNFTPASFFTDVAQNFRAFCDATDFVVDIGKIQLNNWVYTFSSDFLAEFDDWIMSFYSVTTDVDLIDRNSTLTDISSTIPNVIDITDATFITIDGEQYLDPYWAFPYMKDYTNPVPLNSYSMLSLSYDVGGHVIPYLNGIQLPYKYVYGVYGSEGTYCLYYYNNSLYVMGIDRKILANLFASYANLDLSSKSTISTRDYSAISVPADYNNLSVSFPSTDTSSLEDFYEGIYNSSSTNTLNMSTSFPIASDHPLISDLSGEMSYQQELTDGITAELSDPFSQLGISPIFDLSNFNRAFDSFSSILLTNDTQTYIDIPEVTVPSIGSNPSFRLWSAQRVDLTPFLDSSPVQTIVNFAKVFFSFSFAFYAFRYIKWLISLITLHGGDSDE